MTPVWVASGLSLIGVRRWFRSASPIEVGLLVQLPVMMLAVLMWTVIHSPGFDFEIFRQAGEAVLHGRTPYIKPSLVELAKQNHFVYPQPVAYAFVPFSAIPAPLGAALFLLFSVGCLLATLGLLGVTDWRLYGLTLLTAPVFDAAGLGTLGFLLLLLVGVGWRLRGSSWSGLAFAAAAATKLFLWPLVLWLLATRRYRASLAAAVTLVSMVGLWAAADPTGLREYPRTLRLLERGHPSSYSLRGLWIATGLPAAGVVPVVVAALGVLVVVGLRHREREALAASVVVALLATPIMWLHYLVMLVVPLALLRPAFAWPWLLPLALWVTPTSSPQFTTWHIAVAIGVTAGVAAATAVSNQRSGKSLRLAEASGRLIRGRRSPNPSLGRLPSRGSTAP